MTFIRVFIISYIAARILCVCLCVVLRPTSGINSTLSVILCVLQYNTTFGFVLVIVRRRLRIAANVYIIFSQSHRHRLAGWSLGSVVPTVMIDQMEMQCDSSLLRCEFWLWNFLAKLTVKHRLVGNGICERTFRDHWRQESDVRCNYSDCLMPRTINLSNIVIICSFNCCEASENQTKKSLSNKIDHRGHLDEISTTNATTITPAFPVSENK